MSEPPFSARNRGTHNRIDNAFPESARNGLLHILFDLVEREYINTWIPVARELQRIGRRKPIQFDPHSLSDQNSAETDAISILQDLEWDKVFDFCERLVGHLACAVGSWSNGLDSEFQETISRTQVQSYISDELRRLFVEESLAFEFADGRVSRIGRKHTVDTTSRAQLVLGDPKLETARKHFMKAQRFFRDPAKPDYENCVKEAVCSVEAAGKALFPAAKAKTLGDLAKWFTKCDDVSIPPALINTISGIYGYRGGGDGVTHGGASGGTATSEVAEYVLAICASQIIYFVDLVSAMDPDVPF